MAVNVKCQCTPETRLANLMCLNIGKSKTINFPFGTNGKLMVLYVLILKHIRAVSNMEQPQMFHPDSTVQMSFTVCHLCFSKVYYRGEL